MTEETKKEIAIDRAKRLINGRLVIAKRKTPHCCLCHIKIEKGKPYYRLSGGLAGHLDCTERLSRPAADSSPAIVQ